MEVKQMNDSFFCENEGHYFFYDASTGFMSETSRVFNDVISAYRKYNNIEDAKKELSLWEKLQVKHMWTFLRLFVILCVKSDIQEK